MKRLLTLALALVALAVFSGLGVAQQNGVEKNQPADVEKKQPATEEKKTVKGYDAPTYKNKMTAKVMGVDPRAKTFTVMVEGKAVTFSAAKLSKFPTVGENIDITFTWNPGEPPMATSTTESGSKAGTSEEEKQKATHCGGKQWGGTPLYSLHLGGPDCNYN